MVVLLIEGRDKSKKIDLNIDDLPELEETGKVSIDLEDLPLEESNTVTYPSLSGETTSHASKDIIKNVSIELWQLGIAGLIGGTIAWSITELLFNDNYYPNQLYIHILLEMTFFAAIIGGTIGALLGALEGFTSKVSQKIYKGIMVGLLFGFCGGAVGGFIGQIVYSIAGIAAEQSYFFQILARSIAWGVVGLFIGLGQGLGSGGGKKLTNGLLGGLIGGLVGGFLFDIIGLATTTGVLSRAVAIPIIGLCAGIGIGIVQEIRKEAWFKVLQGATSGKEYILYKNKTVIGSYPQCDIVLVKDPEVSLKHAEVYFENYRYIICELPSSKGVWLNNRKVAKQQLNNKDIIGLGNYKLQFSEKTLK